MLFKDQRIEPTITNLQSPSVSGHLRAVASFEPIWVFAGPASEQATHDTAPTSRKQPEDTPAEENRFEDTDETLSKLEEQLDEISFQKQSRAKQIILTHRSYVGIGLLSIDLVT